MNERAGSAPSSSEPERAPGSIEEEQNDAPAQGDDEGAGSTGHDEGQEREQAAEIGLNPVAAVAERNLFHRNVIVVERGDFIGSAGEDRPIAIPTTDVTFSAAELSEDFVEPATFTETVQALEDRRFALLAGKGRGNRVSGLVALHRTGHEPIVELPGALSIREIVDTVKRACRSETAGVLVESIDPETLTSLGGFHLRHLRNALPSTASVVFTMASVPRTVGDAELPVIEGSPPDGIQVLDVLARRSGLGEDEHERCRQASALLPQPIGPSTAAELVGASSTATSPEELIAAIGFSAPVLDEWLADEPKAGRVAALAALGCLDGLPSADFDAEVNHLMMLIEGGAERPTEPPNFGPRERLWPSGVGRLRRARVATYFGRQETEVIEVCPPYRQEGLIAYVWRHLDGQFRRPFLRWLGDLPARSNNRLAFAAARGAGVLFAEDPVTVERELLRPWALEGDAGLRAAAGLALGFPVMIGADPTAARRLVRQWSRSRSGLLQAAATAAYGGPLGIWDPSAAAASNLWEIGDAGGELRTLADAALAAQLVGGRGAGRARATVTALLCAADGKAETARAYAILPRAVEELTSGASRARESLEALLSDSERDTFADLAALLAQAFDDREGRDSAQRAMRKALGATASGRIGRDVVERLIREMKTGAATHGRLPQLGSQLKQLLKAEDRNGGRLQDPARSLYETFYE